MTIAELITRLQELQTRVSEKAQVEVSLQNVWAPEDFEIVSLDLFMYNDDIKESLASDPPIIIQLGPCVRG